MFKRQNMVDNFELVNDIFTFNTANLMFFHCQIVQKRKQHPELNDDRIMCFYLITSREMLQELREEIIWKCNHYRATALINPAPKDFSTLQLEVLRKTACNTANHNTVNIMRLIGRCAAKIKSRTRIYQVDVPDNSMTEVMLEWFDEYFKLDKDLPFGDTRETLYLKSMFPTPEGQTLVTVPFEKEAFKKVFPEVEISTNYTGVTLYSPDYGI